MYASNVLVFEYALEYLYLYINDQMILLQMVSENDKYKEIRKVCTTRSLNEESLFEEIKETWRISWALIIIAITNYSMQPVAQMFGGHLGRDELDALALSNSIINIVCWSTIQGFGSVCSTVFSQTFGSQNYKMMGVYLQRCLILHSFLIIVILVLLINIEHILLLLGQNGKISNLAGHYLLCFSPSVIFIMIYLVLREYIYTQGIIMPDLFISVSAFVLHVGFQYIIIQDKQLGLTGSAIGQICVYLYMAVSTFIYLVASGLYKDTWAGWTMLSVTEWGVMIKLAGYGLLLECLEWWVFDVTILLAGILGTTELATQSIVFNIDIIVYSLSGGYGVASCIRVGWYLGAGYPSYAKTSASAGIVLSFCTSILMFIFLILTRNILPKLFTDDKDILSLSSQILIFIAAYTMFNSVSSICRCVVNGTGMQCIGSYIVFFCYFCVALPLGISLMFLTSWKLYGMWVGLVLARVLSTAMFCFIIYFYFNWEDLSRQAQHVANISCISEQKSTFYGSVETTDTTKYKKSFIASRITIVTLFSAILCSGIIIRTKYG